MNFASDNAAAVAPEILVAIARANDGPALAYGNDACTQRVERPDHAAVAVVSVLQKNRGCEREVQIVARPHGGFDLLWRHDAGGGRDLLDLHPRDGCGAAPLI